MGMYIQIGLVILVLASFVIAFFSARTWHWGHVLVVLGIFLSTLGFFILAAETLRINAILRAEVNRIQRDLDSVNTRNEALAKGTEDANLLNQLRSEDPPVKMPEEAESIPSIAELDHQLLLATRSRGRVWRNVAPVGIEPSGAVRVSVEAPSVVPANTVVYLFEEGPAELPAADGTPQGKQYLGEFRVGAVEGQQATLLPVLPMDANDYEVRRLAASRGPWVIYETMPVDRHAIFSGMSEEDLKQRLPSKSVEEYFRHGKEAGPDDDVARQAGFDADGKRLPPDQLDAATKKLYQRRLRDYATEFDDLSQRRIAMEVDIAAVTKDIERLQASLASAKKLQAFREGEIQRLTTDLAGITKERQAIEQHLALVERLLARGRELLAATLRRNSEMAAELAGRQLRFPASIDGARSPAEPGGPLALGER